MSLLLPYHVSHAWSSDDDDSGRQAILQELAEGGLFLAPMQAKIPSQFLFKDQEEEGKRKETTIEEELRLEWEARYC